MLRADKKNKAVKTYENPPLRNKNGVEGNVSLEWENEPGNIAQLQ